MKYLSLASAVVLLAACVQEIAPMSEQQATSADLVPVPVARRILAEKLGADWAQRPYVDNFLIGCDARRYYKFEDIGNSNVKFFSTGELQIGIQFGGFWDCGGYKSWSVSAGDLADIKKSLRALGARVY